MFLHYYGLREQPFGVTPDPRFLYASAARQEALSALLYGIEMGRGFLVLLGQPGTGKTTLLFELLNTLEDSARTAFLFQTQCDSREFFRYLLDDLGIEPRKHSLAQMHAQLNELLLAEARAGRRFVMIIDEAQDLDESVLETVRLLSNFETARAKLLQIVLSGQPRLADKLASPSLAQLRQRISILSRLDPLSGAETSEYIDHRLRVAGYKGPSLFSLDARAIIAAHSQGIPRAISNLCFNALTIGCAMGKKVIDAAVMREVIRDLDLSPLVTQPLGTDSALASFPNGAVVPVAEPQTGSLLTSRDPLTGSNSPPPVSQPSGSSTPPVSSPAVAGTPSAQPTAEAEVSVSLVDQAHSPSPALPIRHTRATPHSSALPRRSSMAPRPVPPARPVSLTPAWQRGSRWLVWAAAFISLGLFGAGYWYWAKAGPGTRGSSSTRVLASPPDRAPASARDAVVTAPAASARAATSAHGSDVRPPSGDKPKRTAASRYAPKPPSATTHPLGPALRSARRPASLKAAGRGPVASRVRRRVMPNRAARAARGPGGTRGAPAGPRRGQRGGGSENPPAGHVRPGVPANAVTSEQPAPAVSPASGPSVSGQFLVLSGAANLQTPQLISRHLPQYPPPAREAGVGGVVRIACLVGREGSVEEADIVSGPALLRDAALSAAMRWRFKPALSNGRPVEVRVQIDIKFSGR